MAIRRLLDKALEKIDELGERSHQKAMANLTPAERERYEAWEARGEASRNGVPEAQLGDARLTGRVLQGPAGEVVHGVVKAPKHGGARRPGGVGAADARRARGARPGARPVPRARPRARADHARRDPAGEAGRRPGRATRGERPRGAAGPRPRRLPRA